MRFFCGFFCGCLAVVAGLYWALLPPVDGAGARNVEAVVAIAAAVVCVITITWRKPS
jgi:hypothetical protein